MKTDFSEETLSEACIFDLWPYRIFEASKMAAESRLAVPVLLINDSFFYLQTIRL